MTRLAPNFTFEELTHTNHRGLLDANRELGRNHIGSIRAVAEMLQEIRDHFTSPVIVHSGFRCRGLNTAIGGSAYSQHVKGEAADFHVLGVPLGRVFDWVRNESGIKYGQLILEGVAADKPTWLHISLGEPFRDESKSRQAMTWDKTNGYRRV